MAESWSFNESKAPVAADEALDVLCRRIAEGRLESWLASSSGRLLAVVTNTERMMVMRLNDEGDPGEHAVSPGAEGRSRGFVLTNGQDDEYADEDTVPPPEAFRIVRHILTEGSPPPDAAWTVDR